MVKAAWVRVLFLLLVGCVIFGISFTFLCIINKVEVTTTVVISSIPKGRAQ